MSLHPEFEKLLHPMRGTEWSMFEVYQLGEAILNLVNTTCTLGHTRPGNTLDYLKGWAGELPRDFALDFVAWTSGCKDLRPGCEERIREHNTSSGWSRLHLERAMAPLAALVDDARRYYLARKQAI